MLQTRITVDGRDYRLPSEKDAGMIMSLITAEVRAGGGFVEILRTPDRTLSVLVSPALSLSVEVTHVEDQPEGDSEEIDGSAWGPSIIGFDEFDML